MFRKIRVAGGNKMKSKITAQRAVSVLLLSLALALLAAIACFS